MHRETMDNERYSNFGALPLNTLSDNFIEPPSELSPPKEFPSWLPINISLPGVIILLIKLFTAKLSSAGASSPIKISINRLHSSFVSIVKCNFLILFKSFSTIPNVLTLPPLQCIPGSRVTAVELEPSPTTSIVHSPLLFKLSIIHFGPCRRSSVRAHSNGSSNATQRQK